MKASLQVRLSQHLALTPQLQQSIRLLQLSTLELHQEVEQMLELNPFLELEEDATPPWEAALERARPLDAGAAREAEEAGAGAADGPAGSAEEAFAPEALAEMGAADFGTTARDDWENGTEADDFDGVRELPSRARGLASGDDDGPEGRDSGAPAISLAQHLRAQLPGLRLGAQDSAAVLLLIESLDGEGYLADPLEEIARSLLGEDEAGNGAADVPTGTLDEEATSPWEDLMSRLRCALSWLQQLDPAGVGARSLSECLQLQLRLRPASPARALALTVCAQHLDLLARRDVKRILAATGADEALLRQAHALIVACEPKPGRPFADAESLIVVPDVVVQRAGRGLKVSLNPDVMPRLRINDLYAAALRGPRGSAHTGLSARLQEARWFVKNVVQRFDTILRVSEAIVQRQRAFFTHGEIAMKPLVLREIADELGLHESTISRVTTAKYMATPMGTFELKYFFGSALATETGGNASSTAVRALIRQMVAAESPSAPLSDSTLSQMLEEQGIQVARRTVAKYREALKIAPANVRKAM
ncbi:MAG: RNA polymerase factor sigma-54 [Rubrivivax sp.]